MATVVRIKAGDNPSTEVKLEILRAAVSTMEAVLVTLALLELERQGVMVVSPETLERCRVMLQGYLDAVVDDAIGEIEITN
jgi:hypothetical protein